MVKFTQGTGFRRRTPRVPVRRPYVGGRSSLASQPSMSEVMGSPDTTVVCTQPHFWHSKVRVSKPDRLASSFDSSMRFCWHLGQPGRSMAETCLDGTGWNSGMTYRAYLDYRTRSDRTANRPTIESNIEPSGILWRGQNCSLRKTSSLQGERDRRRSRSLQIKCWLFALREGHRRRYRLMRMRHGRTNFAGQPSIRISNLRAAGFGCFRGLSFRLVSFNTVSIKSKTLS
jgi:hypothetical protein